MFKRLIEFILPRIIGAMVHKREILTKKERAAQDAFLAMLNIKRRKTEEPVIVAMIGLVGSGKSSVARELAWRIGATIVEGDRIRVELRRRGERYERTRAIAENVATEVVKWGGSVILDSDFVDGNKRASIREKARQMGVRLVFICVYCDLDVMVGRALTAIYRNRKDDFFGSAKSKWKDSEQNRGAVVKVREMQRRMPFHYRWEKNGYGKWVIKKPPCAVLADIDTTEPASWKREVEKCAKRLLTQ